MSMHRHPVLATVAAGALTVTLAAPASAQIVDRWSLDESFSGTTTEFCGTSLAADYTYSQTGEARLHQRGKDGLLYYHASLSSVQTFTYQGRSVTTYTRILEKDVHLDDNGDGTWDALVMLTGPSRTVNQEGRVINKDDGQIRVVLVIDAATGEPIGDPEVVFGSTGTNGDFCAAVLEYWGI